MNTLGGNTLGLLREVRNFVLFRIHGCMVQRSLNENIIFCFILLPRKLSKSPSFLTQQKKWFKNNSWPWTAGFQPRKPQEVRLPLRPTPNKLRPMFPNNKGNGKRVPTVLWLGTTPPCCPLPHSSFGSGVHSADR